MGKYLTSIGVVGTALYAYLLYWLISGRYFALAELKLHEMGLLLAGVFVPLTFFWLVLALSGHARQIRKNTEVLEYQAGEFEKSVQQQKDFISVATRQMDTDIEVLDESKRRLAQAAQPDFVFEGVSNISSGDDIRYRSSVKNTGATVTRVAITSDCDLQISPSEMPSCASGSEVRITWSYPGNITLGVCVLKIKFLDKAGNPGSQVFSITTTGIEGGLRVDPVVQDVSI